MKFDIFDTDVFGFVGDVYFKYHFNDIRKPLVITFSPAVLMADLQAKAGKDPWGFSFVKNTGYNVLSFSCTKLRNNYYRDETFISCVEDIGNSLPCFAERLGYGGSMGGYGVSAYSVPLQIDRVLLINPISTRNKEIASWDWDAGRSLFSFNFDWHSKYFDGASNTSLEGYVIYDPLFDLDKKHAERYKNLTKLKVTGLGHGLPGHLLEMKMLRWLFFSFVEGSIDSYEFHRRAKARRFIGRYYQWLLSKENKHLTANRARIIKSHRRKSIKLCAKNGHSIYQMKSFLGISDQEVSLLRDMAKKMEDYDVELAYQLMLLASKLRPNGSGISAKVKEYKKIISNVK